MGHYGLALQSLFPGVGTGALWDLCPFPYRALSYITIASKQGWGRA